MKIRFFNTDELDKPIRIAVHTSGKMGFSKEAEKKLNLPKRKTILLGKNEEDESDDSLYMALKDEDIKGGFKVLKAGEYYYINTKILFDNLKIEYKKSYLGYDMSLIDPENEYYQLRLIKKQTKKKESDGSNQKSAYAQE